ncbi:MAG TPA: hypothetical protein VFU47_13635, partial [Armatimonadota bacterium]|nr:hypothetical protein [Armatimonadota bacterium]
MKFHALALCLTGVLATGIAAAADDMSHDQMRSDSRIMREHDRMMDGTYSYAGETIYVRDVLYPDLPPVSEVAQKVADITEHNKREAAELAALAGAARTQGWENIAAVYDHMAQDHVRGADMTSNWLVSYGYTPPPAPTISLAAETNVRDSIQQQIDMHTQLFEESREKRMNERSSTVRGLLLMDMATALNHISLLQSLQRDVSFDRRTLSARLEAQMNPTAVALNEQTLARIDEEWRAQFPEITPPPVVVETPAPPAVVQQQ